MHNPDELVADEMFHRIHPTKLPNRGNGYLTSRASDLLTDLQLLWVIAAKAFDYLRYMARPKIEVCFDDLVDVPI